MLKFFRKYNKTLLALFMVLLMVVWLGGQALDNFLRPNMDVLVAHSKVGDIGTLDQQAADSTTRLLTSMQVDWQKPVLGTLKPLDLVDWILLTREAESLETRASVASAKAWLGGEAGDAGDILHKLARRMRTKPEVILAAVGQLRSIQLASQAISGAAVPSEAEVRRAGRNILDKVVVHAVVLPAAAFVDKNATFTEDEIEKQWKPYRDVKDGEGLNFGYYLPHTLLVQFIRIQPAKIAEHIGIANLETKARKYYDEHRAEFPRTTPPPTEGGEPPSPLLSWEEAKEAAIAAVRKQRADEAATRLADWIVQYASESFLDVERGHDGYKPAPPQVATTEYYVKLLEQVPPTIAVSEGVDIGMSGNFTQENVQVVPGIGEASHRSPNGEVRTFKQLAFRNQAVVPTVPEEKGGNRSDFLSLYQTCPYPVTNPDGDIYVFRVLKSGDGRPSLLASEAQDRIVEDLRLLRGMAAAKKRGEQLSRSWPDTPLKEAYADELDLAELKETEKGEGLGFFISPPVSRQQLGQLGSDQAATTAFAGPGIGLVPQELIETWFHLEDAEPKVIVQELKDRAAVLVVQWVETQTGREDEFARIREQIASQLADRRSRNAVSDWMDPEKIRARNGFALAR